jgi:hypothetical protein
MNEIQEKVIQIAFECLMAHGRTPDMHVLAKKIGYTHSSTVTLISQMVKLGLLKRPHPDCVKKGFDINFRHPENRSLGGSLRVGLHEALNYGSVTRLNTWLQTNHVNFEIRQDLLSPGKFIIIDTCQSTKEFDVSKVFRV